MKNPKWVDQYRETLNARSKAEAKLLKALTKQKIEAIQNHPVETFKEKWRFIDLYLPKFNIAIEVDDPSHNKRRMDDKFRTKAIKKRIHCKFLRYPTWRVLENTADVVGHIIGMIALWNDPKEREALYRFRKEFQEIDSQFSMIARFG